MDKIWNSSVFTFIFLKIIFEILFFTLYLHPHWRGGRVVDRGGLENRWLSQVRGFESLPLRWTNRTLPDNEQPSPTNSTICGTFLSPYVCPGHHLEERTGNPDRSTDSRVTWSDCFYKILISKMIPNVRRQKTSVS